MVAVRHGIGENAEATYPYLSDVAVTSFISGIS